MHVAVIVLSNNKIIVGYNSPYCHAEEVALKIFNWQLKNKKIDKKIKIKYLFSGRISQTGELRNGKPCKNCSRLIYKNRRINSIVYSTNNGFFEER